MPRRGLSVWAVRSTTRRRAGAPLAWVAALLMLLIADAGSVQAQQGIACDPAVRVDNPACANDTICRRFAASCFGLGVVCNDAPSSNRATAPTWLTGICGAFCSAGFGLCEDRIVVCDSDGACGIGERCMIGVCTFVPRVCNEDADCGAGNRCVNFRCQAAEGAPTALIACQSDSDCPSGEACFSERCYPRCAADEDAASPPVACPDGLVCVDGMCRPI